MTKYKYTIMGNEIIVHPGTAKEQNITENGAECRYCMHDRRTCEGNKLGRYCDWFKIKFTYSEV